MSVNKNPERDHYIEFPNQVLVQVTVTSDLF